MLGKKIKTFAVMLVWSLNILCLFYLWVWVIPSKWEGLGVKLSAEALACCVQGPGFKLYHWKKKEGKPRETAVRKPDLDELCLISYLWSGQASFKGDFKVQAHISLLLESIPRQQSQTSKGPESERKPIKMLESQPEDCSLSTGHCQHMGTRFFSRSMKIWLIQTCI